MPVALSIVEREHRRLVPYPLRDDVDGHARSSNNVVCRQATARDIGVLLEYAYEIQLAAWFECDG